MYNVGIFNENTRVIEIYYNQVSEIEIKDREILFVHQGAPWRVSISKDNYVIVDSSVELHAGMSVDDIKDFDMKDQFKMKNPRELESEIKLIQKIINFLLGL